MWNQHPGPCQTRQSLQDETTLYVKKWVPRSFALSGGGSGLRTRIHMRVQETSPGLPLYLQPPRQSRLLTFSTLYGTPPPRPPFTRANRRPNSNTTVIHRPVNRR